MTALSQRQSLAVALTALALVACGPNVTVDDIDARPSGPTVDAYNPSRPDAFPGVYGGVRGTVWAPANAPGMVPSGHEIPVFGAIVFTTALNPLENFAIPNEVYCEQCSDPPTGADVTGPDGVFDLPNLAPGNYYLVIRKAQFQLAQQITINPNETIELPATQTTLPSEHNPAAGKWIPSMALAEGLWDEMEDILAKAGMGELDGGDAFVCGSQDGVYDLYINGSADCEGEPTARGDFNELIGDLNLMKMYHIIFVPCSNGDTTQLFGNPVWRENILEYVKAGGKFYVTDWSAEWEDAVFPQFVVFQDEIDTVSPSGPFGSGNGFPGYESEHAKAQNAELNAWLEGQQGPLVSGYGAYTDGTVDADDFVVEGNYDHIEDVPGVQIGVDNDNLPIIEIAEQWVIGDWGDGGSTNHPLTVTFEPIGCGRVLYSTYHTADSEHEGLIPQERVLLYLLMEIGVCKSGPIIE